MDGAKDTCAAYRAIKSFCCSAEMARDIAYNLAERPANCVRIRNDTQR